VAAAAFDEPNLVSAAGLVPVLALAQRCGLQELADEWLSVPTDKGAHAGAKGARIVAGADSIYDMPLLRHGAMGTVFDRPYGRSTLGSFLRCLRVRARLPTQRGRGAGVGGSGRQRTPVAAGINGPVMVDDTVVAKARGGRTDRADRGRPARRRQVRVDGGATHQVWPVRFD
jgi:hypothetical protein